MEVKNTALTKKDFDAIKVLRSLTPEETTELADYVEHEMISFGERKPNDPRVGQKIDRGMLKLWGHELGKFGRPSVAMQCAAESAKMSEELASMLGGRNIQNELTTTAMIMAVDLACRPPPDVVESGSPDLSDLA